MGSEYKVAPLLLGEFLTKSGAKQLAKKRLNNQALYDTFERYISWIPAGSDLDVEINFDINSRIAEDDRQRELAREEREALRQARHKAELEKINPFSSQFNNRFGLLSNEASETED